MFDIFLEPFFLYGIAIAVILAITAAILSPYMVLSQQALIGDGLAHVGFSGIIIGILVSSQPVLVAIPITVLAALIIRFLMTKLKIPGDATIGIISALSLSIGLIIINSSTGFNTSIEDILVGRLFTVRPEQIIIALIILIVIATFTLINYRKLLLITYDYQYAKFKGVNVNLLSYSLSGLAALFIAVGIQTIGTLLISSFIIFPAIIASNLFKSFKNSAIFGIIISVATTIVGILSAHYLNFPVGSTIVCLNTIVVIISILYKTINQKRVIFK